MSGPLTGRRVVVTRTREQAAGLVDRLHALGADVVVVPLITTVPIATPDEIRVAARALAAAPPPRWVAFTSATAVRLVTGAVGAPELDTSMIAAVGCATAKAVTAAGLEIALTTDLANAGALAEAMVARGVHGGTVWLPVAEGAGDALDVRLRRAGAQVMIQRAYRSAMPEIAPALIRRALAARCDAITLTSGSTARHLVAALDGAEVPDSAHVVCIGERTAAEARAAGLRVDAVAGEASAAGIAAAIERLLGGKPLP